MSTPTMCGNMSSRREGSGVTASWPLSYTQRSKAALLAEPWQRKETESKNKTQREKER